MSNVVSNIQLQTNIESEPSIIVPEGLNYSGLCELLYDTQDGYSFGFQSTGFSIEDKRQLAKIASDIVGLVSDPDWVYLVESCKLPIELAPSLAELGLLLHVETSTGLSDENGDPIRTSIVLGITSRVCGHRKELRCEVGQRLEAAFRDYAESRGIAADFANVELVTFVKHKGKPNEIRETLVAAKDQFDFVDQLKKDNGGVSPFDERAFQYFSGWLTRDGYLKMCAIHDEISGNEEKYFGEEAENTPMPRKVPGPNGETMTTLRNNSINLLSHVAGCKAGYERVMQLNPKLACIDAISRIPMLQHASELARHEAMHKIAMKYANSDMYASAVAQLKKLTHEAFSIIEGLGVEDTMRTLDKEE